MDSAQNFHIETTNEVLFLKNAYRSLSRAIFQFFVLTTWVISNFGLVRSVASSLFDWITSIRTTHEGAPFSGWKVKCQRSHRSFKVFVVSATWLPPYLTSHFICGIHRTHEGRCVTHHFRIKGQRSRSHGSFKFFTLSALWLPPYCLVKYVGIWWLWHAAAIRSLDLFVFQ